MSEDSIFPEAPEGSVRLNKFLASCGYESRRAADRLIAEGRVEVNGRAVDTPGLRVLPTDYVKVDGRHATPKEEIALLLNKPRGYVCSREAQGAIGTVYDLLPPKYRYANYVGRLDADSEGLLIFTNSGVLVQTLGHPSNGIEKEYWVTLDQAFDSSVLLQLLKGVRIPEGQAKAKYISRLSARRACVVLEQGLKRQIRQMFSCLGLRVKKLVRVRIGSLWGGDLEPGGTLLLNQEQIALATTNPRRRKGLMGAKQVFKPKPTAQQTLSEAQEEDDDNYIFNPADFETDENNLDTCTKFTDGESFEPEREKKKGMFGRARGSLDPEDNQRGIRPNFEKRPFRDRKDFDKRSFGERPFRDRKNFGERNSGERPFRDRKNFGERSFGERPFRDRKNFGERSFGERPFRDRKNFGERSFGERLFRDRKNFGERNSGERPFRDRKDFGERSFGNRPFRDRKNSSERSFGNRPFRDRRDSSERSFGKHPFRDRKDFGKRNFGERKTFNQPNRKGRQTRTREE